MLITTARRTGTSVRRGAALARLVEVDKGHVDVSPRLARGWGTPRVCACPGHVFAQALVEIIRTTPNLKTAFAMTLR